MTQFQMDVRDAYLRQDLNFKGADFAIEIAEAIEENDIEEAMRLSNVWWNSPHDDDISDDTPDDEFEVWEQTGKTRMSPSGLVVCHNETSISLFVGEVEIQQAA